MIFGNIKIPTFFLQHFIFTEQPQRLHMQFSQGK